MSIDARFALEAFRVAEERGQARELADALQDEILRELHAVVEPAFLEIVEKLRRLGHDLKPYTPPVPGDLNYRDDEESADGYRCRMRVGVDMITSVGYADTTAPVDDDEPK
ncbi:hypothetical protein [Sorangium sp. So ce854]|uniref:hypothetical protein n=1 Tax=Sorangium sp. So ce854 TaxID=3133322 RepID=UPI003F642D95